jgi:adenosylmethionine-8-amino-7-oxononanoate aminotransferase
MQHSYHGDTIGAMSMGERGVYNAAYEPLLFGVDTDPYPAPAPNRRPMTPWRPLPRLMRRPSSSSR